MGQATTGEWLFVRVKASLRGGGRKQGCGRVGVGACVDAFRARQDSAEHFNSNAGAARVLVRPLDSGWRPSCTVSGPQLHSSLGSTGLRPMLPRYYRDLAHGPGVGSGQKPRLPPPTCLRPISGVGGPGTFLFCGSLAVVSRPVLAHCFRSAICDCLSINGCFSRYLIHTHTLPCTDTLLYRQPWCNDSVTPMFDARVLLFPSTSLPFPSQHTSPPRTPSRLVNSCAAATSPVPCWTPPRWRG
jgi:hypothetical protein